MSSEDVRIGTAGWSAPKTMTQAFPASGSHLERYAATLNCVEINTSFYRPHKPATYARWAAAVPTGFRFAVKAPRSITHEARLIGTRSLLATFFDQVGVLGEALGPVLFQLPPSLKFDRDGVLAFLEELRAEFPGDVALEPRHTSWFTGAAEDLLLDWRVARVAADPACCSGAARPGGWPGLRYWRLHGSPKVYWTPYGDERLGAIKGELAPSDWCIFDNTASGAAIVDALKLHKMIMIGEQAT